MIDKIKAEIIKANKTTNIEDLINSNLKLAGYLFLLNELETEIHKGYIEAYNTRKIVEARCDFHDLGGIVINNLFVFQ